MLYSAKGRAKKRGISCTVTPQFLFDLYEKQEGMCALTGFKMSTIYGEGRKHRNISLDRIDNTKGYSQKNVQLVCHIVNIMKNNLTQEEFIEYCKAIISR